MQKANIIKKIITGAILVVALVIFFSASKHRLPAPENLVAQVYIPKVIEGPTVLNFSFNAVKDGETGKSVRKYKVEIKNYNWFGKKLYVLLDIQTGQIEGVQLGRKLLNQNVLIGSTFGIKGEKVVGRLDIPQWLNTVLGIKEKNLPKVSVKALDSKGEFGNSIEARVQLKKIGGSDIYTPVR